MISQVLHAPPKPILGVHSGTQRPASGPHFKFLTMHFRQFPPRYAPTRLVVRTFQRQAAPCPAGAHARHVTAFWATLCASMHAHAPRFPFTFTASAHECGMPARMYTCVRAAAWNGGGGLVGSLGFRRCMVWSGVCCWRCCWFPSAHGRAGTRARVGWIHVFVRCMCVHSIQNVHERVRAAREYMENTALRRSPAVHNNCCS